MNKTTLYPVELMPPQSTSSLRKAGTWGPLRSEGRLRDPQGLSECCCWTQKVLGDRGRVFVPTGIGNQHPTTSACEGACGQSRGGDRMGVDMALPLHCGA